VEIGFANRVTDEIIADRGLLDFQPATRNLRPRRNKIELTGPPVVRRGVLIVPADGVAR
jgi:hypothetical protein